MSEDDYLWDELPSFTGYIALGRRGMESIALTQCFIPGCDNQDIKKLHPIVKQEGGCLFCKNKPKYSVRLENLDDYIEPIRVVLVCSKHIGRYMKMLFRLFKSEHNLRYLKAKVNEEINRRIVGRSYRTHPREKMDYIVKGTY